VKGIEFLSLKEGVVHLSPDRRERRLKESTPRVATVPLRTPTGKIAGFETAFPLSAGERRKKSKL
jgi:hypothetical protein